MNLEEKFKRYRERSCDIENKKLDIEKLKISNIDNKEIQISEIEKEIKQLELENHKIENIVKLLLNEREYNVICLIYMEGKNKKETAKQLDRTERQINYAINTAFKRLSEKM
ncbi:RNA polymerase sigma factor, sigma-70 family [Clostridium neonatale]|uniref:sigma factor-like helix-turn-helix DNA-binding protein n=1 Tax=Clostridium neonatale TaxID=137838 RepID=UPI00291C005A|nr:RNA polymerase subunit sigma-70 [Clostridium neonatale]CAI3248341.1 RNA polymerase sigma factor, sigma-70 family [Clostridium neonatale]